MRLYRAYFYRSSDWMRGRDDFEAEDDCEAIIMAEALCDACSDVCDHWALWQDIRFVDSSEGKAPRQIDTTRQITRKMQESVIRREIAIRDSRWAIASSRRLIDQTQQLVAAVVTKAESRPNT